MAKHGREQKRRPLSAHADTTLLIQRGISALAIFLTLLTLPLIARAGWREKIAETSIQEKQQPNNEFPISFVPNGRQINPATACSPEDRCLSVWEDHREEDWDVYGQWVVDGKLEGENFPISTAPGDQHNPAIAYDSSEDKYLVVWWDARNYVMTGYDIYGRLITSNGDAGTPRLGDSDCALVTAMDNQQHPDITYNNTNGEYLVVWQDFRHGDWDIHGRRISNDCTPLGNDFTISRAAGRQWYPAVAYNSLDDQYLAVWQDNRNPETTGQDIYGQIVFHDGALLGDNFAISTAESFQRSPDVAYNSVDDEYLAVWADNRSAASTGLDIYGQRVSSGGELMDEEGNAGANPALNFAISRATNDQERPVLAYNDEMDQYLAVWQDLRHENLDVFAQLVSGQGELLDNAGRAGADPTVNFPIAIAPNSQEHPVLTYSQGKYLILWQDERYSDFVEEDVYGQWISGQGELLSGNFPLITTPSYQPTPAAAYGGNPRYGSQSYLVVWEDRRNSADTSYDIYGQMVEITNEFQGANFPISTAAQDQQFPAIASNAQGEYLVVWQDSREESWDIYGQWVVDGKLEGENFPISAAPGDQYDPAVVYNSSKNEYLVVWWDARGYVRTGYDIYGRLIAGNEVGDSDCPIITVAGNQQYPDVAYNSTNGEYLVLWQDFRHGEWDIYGRRLSDNCAQLGNDFSISRASGRQWYPALAYNSSENQYLAVWGDNRNTELTDGDIYGQRLSPEGELLSDDFPISIARTPQRFPDVAYSNFDNDYLAVWGDNRNSINSAFDIYGQRVASDGKTKGENFPVSKALDGQRHPALAYHELQDQCIVVWNALHWGVYGELLVDMSISAEAPIKAPPGSDVVYTISYHNEGSSDAQNVLITDTLPSVMTYISDTAPFSQTVVENTVAWEVGTLAGGTWRQFTLTARVSPTATTGSALTNTVQINTSAPESDYSNNSAQTATKIPLWTFMAYLNGDNDLDPFMEEAFNKMEQAAQNPDVNVLALWDRCSLLSDDGRECLDPNEGLENTRLYRVEYDDSNLITSPVQEVDWNPGELNMGDPETLENFVTWARDNYPAKYYLLSILDHGGGWSPTFPDESSQRLTSPSLQDFIPLRRSYYMFGGTGLSWDFSDDYDYLSTAEMRRAFCTITREGTEKMDVVFYDACLMGMIEEVYALKEYVNYFIGSANEAWGSMPYDRYLNSITTSTQPRELAVGMVNDYTASLPLTGHPSTMSAVDLAAIDAVSLAVDSLAQAMIEGLTSPETTLQLKNAYLLAQKFDYDSDLRLEEETDGYVDLYHLALNIQENVTDTAIVEAAQAVTNALGSGDGPFIIAEQHRSGYPWVITEPVEYWNLDNAHGISIYLPLGQDLQMILENAEGLAKTIKVRDWYNETSLSFAADTQWDEFIAAYYVATSTPIPTFTLPGPREGIRPIHWRTYLPRVFK